MFQLGSLNELKGYKIPLNKIIFSIDLRIQSIKPLDYSYAEMSFPYVSSSNFISLRIF